LRAIAERNVLQIVAIGTINLLDVVAFGQKKALHLAIATIQGFEIDVSP